VLLPIFTLVLLGLTVRTLVCAPPPPRVVLTGETMGTTWSVVLNAPGLERDGRVAAQDAVQQALDDVDAAMSTWNPESEISRFNAHTSLEPFGFSGGALEVLTIAQDISSATRGAFDVTVRPLVAAWGFGASARLPGDSPSPAELDAIGARVGYERLVLDAETSTVRKLHPELEIDLSAVAKGYGVDRAVVALEALGHADHLVEVGGEVSASGHRPDGAFWTLGIERPTAEGRAIHGVVSLDGLAMATSGDYRSFYEQDGARVTHIIDPRSGRPASHDVASVSVVDERAAVADAWATALTVLGKEEGSAIAAEAGVSAYWILHDGKGGFRSEATPTFPPVERVPQRGNARD
jgi:thiamine biosynthesis lipoprotein